MRRNWFLFVRGHHCCSFPQQRELGAFDKQCKDPVGLKWKRVKGVCKSSPALMILRKGNLLWGVIPAAVLFQDDWIITSFDAWFYFWFKDNKEPQTGVGLLWTSWQQCNTAKLQRLKVQFQDWQDSCLLLEFLGVPVLGLSYSEQTTRFQTDLHYVWLCENLI